MLSPINEVRKILYGIEGNLYTVIDTAPGAQSPSIFRLKNNRGNLFLIYECSCGHTCYEIKNDGKKATTYKGKRQTQLKEFGVIVADQPIVFENRIITSWNPSTAIHVAFMLLEALTTKENAENIKLLMGF